MKNTKNRSGIALIIVLGFLAIMLVMGLAFSVSMRTERLASEVSRDAIQVGQLLRAGLADSLDYLNEQYVSGSVKRALPKQDALLESRALSGDPNPTKLGTAVELCSGEASEWIPAKFLNGGDYDFDAVGRADTVAEWVLVQDLAPGANNRIVGRYGYLVLDCTGQLDANVVDDTSIRMDGANYTRSIRIDDLPEVNNAANFHLNRRFFNMFGTFSEIMLLNDGVLPTYTCYTEERAALDPAQLNNFCSYSWCYDRGWWNGSQWNDYLDGGALVQADFEDAGYDSSTAANLVDALTHFVDADKDCDPNGICYEAVPMINEVAITNVVSGTAGVNIRNDIYVCVEVWYPFPSNPDGDTYEVVVTFNYTESPIVGLAPAAGDVPVSTTFIPNSDGVQWLTMRITKSLAAWPVVDWPDPTDWEHKFAAYNATVEIRKGGVVVDWARPPNVQCFSHAVNTLPLSDSQYTFKYDSVLDPRLNHEASSWKLNKLSAKRLNDNLPGFNKSQNGMYEGCNLYVKDGALGSIDEVGYLFTGQPWTSIDLFSPEGAYLLERYRVGTVPSSKMYTNGLVNPNSHFGEVLKALFRDVPYEASPVTTITNRLTDSSKLDYITNGIMAISSQTPFANSVDWVLNDAFQPGGGLDAPTCALPFSNQEKDAIIRNSYRLFNAQQNLHTILVVAQGVNDQGTIGEWDDEDDSITGEKRAVAVVWRDPFPDANGTYEVLIRQFKYLDE